MAGDHDGDGPIHQAPWVVPVTIAACFAVPFVVMMVRFFFGAELGGGM